MSITNISAKVESEVKIHNVRWIYDLHTNNLLHYDRERLQRLLTKWFEGKRNSYLTTLFNTGRAHATVVVVPGRRRRRAVRDLGLLRRIGFHALI